MKRKQKRVKCTETSSQKMVENDKLKNIEKLTKTTPRSTWVRDKDLKLTRSDCIRLDFYDLSSQADLLCFFNDS